MRKIIHSLIFILVIMAQITFSQAEVGRKTPSLDGIDSAGPYYNPATKSYFELVRIKTAQGTKRPRWMTAKTLAEEKIFKNTKGRLAIIRGLATHQFFTQHFKAKNYWIGLQYFCKSQALTWIDGSDATESNFSAWSSKWSNSHIRCAGKGYMGVRYTTDTATGALRWRATGPSKFYDLYMVEYPTGKE